MKRILYSILFASAAVLWSCEGIVGKNGRVFSSMSKQPLNNVKVQLFLDNKWVKTDTSDSMGRFHGSMFVGCMPDCPVAKIILSRDSFISQVIEFKPDYPTDSHALEIYLVSKH